MKQCQKEINTINEKKHKAKLGVTNIKNKMLKDMEDFSHELNVAKQNITAAQNNILTTIRDQLIATQSTAMAGGPNGFNSTHLSGRYGSQYNDSDSKEATLSANQAELNACLQDTGFKSIDELVAGLESSEEQMFALYNETQEKEEEMEKIDLDNKHLEQQVEAKV